MISSKEPIKGCNHNDMMPTPKINTTKHHDTGTRAMDAISPGTTTLGTMIEY